VKFLVDMPLSPGLAVWLAQQGHDAGHAGELGLAQASDEAILQRARFDGDGFRSNPALDTAPPGAQDERRE
jgi:predicted nuclease of predicted toxin-antitoxin system